MSSLDREISRKVTQWLGRADEDLLLAQHGLTLTSRCPCRLIAYHAQQCVEKHLKAYLVYHRRDFPYTHSVAKLLTLCAEDATWTKTLEEAKRLTAYSITARYPGEDKEVTREEAQNALAIAAHVRDVVRAALIEEGYEPIQHGS